MAFRRCLRAHVLKSKLFLFPASTSACFGGHCTQRFISAPVVSRINVAKSDQAINHMTCHVPGISSISLNKFHLSAFREEKSEARVPMWISKKFGKECVIIPIAINSLSPLQKKLSELSVENDVGYYIKSAGEMNNFNVHLYGKTKEEAESVGRLLKEYVEGIEKDPNPVPLYPLKKFVSALPEEGDIPPSHLLFRVVRFKDDELKKLERNFECRIYFEKFAFRKGFRVCSNDAMKLKKAEMALKEVVEEALKELRSADVLNFFLPDDFSIPQAVLQECEKEFGEDVYLGTSKEGEKIKVTIYADSKETAAKFHAYILESIQRKTEEAKNQCKKIVKINKYAASFRKHLNTNVRKLARNYQPNVKINFLQSPNNIKRAECIITGDNEEEVQKVLDQILMAFNSFRPLPKQPLSANSSNAS